MQRNFQIYFKFFLLILSFQGFLRKSETIKTSHPQNEFLSYTQYSQTFFQKWRRMRQSGKSWHILQTLSKHQLNDESRDSHRSKSGKFNPQRSPKSSDLGKSIRVINASKIHESSSILQEEKSKVQSPKRKSHLPLGLNLRNKLHRVVTEVQDIDSPASPNVDRQLEKARRNIQRQKNQKQIHYSLDEEHRYLHNQIAKIKAQFTNFKKLVLNELIHQKKTIQELAEQIFDKLDNCLRMSKSNYHLQKMLAFSQQTPVPPQSARLTESNLTMKKLSLNLSEFQSSKRVQTQMGSITERNNHSKNDDGVISSDIRDDKTERTGSKSKSQTKRQFDRLFKAVNCLKNDIKSLGGFKNPKGEDEKAEDSSPKTKNPNKTLAGRAVDVQPQTTNNRSNSIIKWRGY